MNNSNSHQPRFVCRVVRFWNATGSRHAATCPDCQRYFGACDGLESSLRRAARSQREDVSAGLEQQIARAVNLSIAPQEPSNLLRPGLLALTGLAVAIALAAIQFNKAPMQGPAYRSGQDVPQPGVFTPSATGATSGNSVVEQWNAVLPPARELLSQDPLQDEMDSVYHDAKSAVSFLAQNFLPTARS